MSFTGLMSRVRPLTEVAYSLKTILAFYSDFFANYFLNTLFDHLPCIFTCCFRPFFARAVDYMIKRINKNIRITHTQNCVHLKDIMWYVKCKRKTCTLCKQIGVEAPFQKKKKTRFKVSAQHPKTIYTIYIYFFCIEFVCVE